MEITYPNGAFWSASVTESDGTYGWNEEYDMKGTVYPTGDTLETVLHNAGVTYISQSGEKKRPPVAGAAWHRNFQRRLSLWGVVLGTGLVLQGCRTI